MAAPRKEPNERAIPDLSPEDWDVAVQWRPLAYRAIKDFVSKATKRRVLFKGKIGTPSFQWYVDEGSAYGVDPVGLCQDMEHRALEAIAVAAKAFRERGTAEHISEAYLRKAILRELQHEFDRWVVSSTSTNTLHYGSSVAPILPEGVQEPSYLMDFDQDEPDGLTDEDREKLQAALGALSSKEAIALRMVADGTPMDEIATNLGYKNVQAVYKLIATAREKGQKAYEAS